MSYLDVRDLSVAYRTRHGEVIAINGITFSLEKGESLGLVGESGCGKSTLATALLGLMPQAARITSGSIDLNKKPMLGIPAEELRQRRWREIAYIPQGAAVAMSPVSSINRHFVETWQAHQKENGNAIRSRAENLFREVELDPAWLNAFPHQLSGGMRQRAIIALSLLFQPQLLIADEPTTGLDVIVQRQVLEALKHLQREHETTLIFVSHDIAVVAELCKQLAVMYGGQIVERGSTSDVLAMPKHPYTMALRRSFPDIRTPEKPLASIPGRPPILQDPPKGCVFSDRCPFAIQRCRNEPPALRTIGDVQVACHLAENAESMAQAFNSDTVWEGMKEASLA